MKHQYKTSTYSKSLGPGLSSPAFTIPGVANLQPPATENPAHVAVYRLHAYHGRGRVHAAKANWQNPPAERRMISWMQRHTRYVNNMPAAALGGNLGLTLDPLHYATKQMKVLMKVKSELWHALA
jgi:hypothetical protein